jgi:CRP-like cAMP-binding protein
LPLIVSSLRLRTAAGAKSVITGGGPSWKPGNVALWPSGLVIVLSRSAGHAGAMIAWAVRRPGSFVGLEAILEPTYRDTATCVSPVLAGSVSRETMDTLLDVNARPVLEQVLATSAGAARVWGDRRPRGWRAGCSTPRARSSPTACRAT